eukprot:ANDGO_02238.mRNA.1 hypothetical protein
MIHRMRASLFTNNLRSASRIPPCGTFVRQFQSSPSAAGVAADRTEQLDKLQKPAQTRPSPSEEIVHAEMNHGGKDPQEMVEFTVNLIKNDPSFGSDGTNYEDFIRYINTPEQPEIQNADNSQDWLEAFKTRLQSAVGAFSKGSQT